MRRGQPSAVSREFWWPIKKFGIQFAYAPRHIASYHQLADNQHFAIEGTPRVTDRYWWTACCMLAMAGIAGCESRTIPRFTPSQQVAALIEDVPEEEQELWEGLQQQIHEALTERFGTPLRPRSLARSDADPQYLQRGAEIYTRRCEQCHGVSGDGQGPVAEYLNPRPRDYRPGIYKFTSTPFGSKPRREDLLRTLRRGIPGTAMPSFDELPPSDLEAVVDYILILTHRGELESLLAQIAFDEAELDPEVVEEMAQAVLAPWEDASSQIVMPVSEMPEFTEESIAQGRDLYLQRACNKCHGADGRGSAYGNVEIATDAWGNTTAAADLTSGMFRGGGRPIDIYRRIYSGINGTPMPGFGAAFADDPDAIWRLVHFIKETGERRRRDEPPPTSADTETSSPPVDEPQPEENSVTRLNTPHVRAQHAG